jgi:hypothetical protein
MTLTTISQFDVYERHAPRPALIEPVTTCFAEGATPSQALFANLKRTMQAAAVADFTAENGQVAPLTASASGAGGVTFAIAGAGAVAANGFVSTSASTTFTPAYSTALVTYFGETASPTPGVPDVLGGPYLAKQRYLAAIGSSMNSAPPTVVNFEGQTTGATSLTIDVANYYSTQSGTGFTPTIYSPTTCTVTGATVAATQTLGRFNVDGGLGTNGKYLACTSGTDVVFTFDYGISAFGFYATDLGDVEGALMLYMLPDDGGAEESVVAKATAGTNGNLVFFGFTNPTKRYTRVRLVCATPVDIYGIDQVITACGMMVLNPNPMKAFGLTLLDYGKTVGTTYSAQVVTTQATYNFTLPVTTTGATGSRAFWGFKCNGGHKITSVTVTSSTSSDAPTFDDVMIGFPYYS